MSYPIRNLEVCGEKHLPTAHKSKSCVHGKHIGGGRCQFCLRIGSLAASRVHPALASLRTRAKIFISSIEMENTSLERAFGHRRSPEASDSRSQ
jgi:hypothetical protein